jgi:hypothetical protein
VESDWRDSVCVPKRVKWRGAPKRYGPKTLYNHSVRWYEKGVFAKILQKLSKEGTEILMVHKPFESSQNGGEPKKGDFSLAHWATKDGARQQATCCLRWPLATGGAAADGWECQ